MGFKRGDIVISKINRDPSIEAVVDFETQNGDVYISEWGRPLSYPTRLILNKDKLILKNKKITVTRGRLQTLIRDFFGEDIDYFNITDLNSVKTGDILKINGTKYVYLQEYCNGIKILGRLCNTYIINKDYISNMYGFTDDELSRAFKTKEDIIHRVFGESVNVKDVEIVDDTTGEVID